MVKVITYGTYDMLHYGHIRLLERAKALGDYLIVGVTSDDYDRVRGKINNQQSLMERIAAVRATGLADEIIVEEYDGQKIDDIRRMGVDIFTVGSDWTGKFDYLNDYCQVIYLPRTEGISSTKLRAEQRKLRIGILGNTNALNKFIHECSYVNGASIIAPFPQENNVAGGSLIKYLEGSDAVFINSTPDRHYEQIRTALTNNKHVLCLSPLTTNAVQCRELFSLAKERKLVLMDGIKTAFSTAYERLILLAKSGKIGDIVSVDAVCTSMSGQEDDARKALRDVWNSICAWGPIAMLPVFQLLGTQYRSKTITTRFLDEKNNLDAFTKVDFTYPRAAASIKVAKGAKAEGELVIAGTKGYIYVPAPWWKTDYFELRYEDSKNNKRYFYQLDGEGIRYELVAFARMADNPQQKGYISEDTSTAIAKVIEDFNNRTDLITLG